MLFFNPLNRYLRTLVSDNLVEASMGFTRGCFSIPTHIFRSRLLAFGASALHVRVCGV
jgi:hypothetical protein